jgi:hypothetical protein
VLSLPPDGAESRVVLMSNLAAGGKRSTFALELADDQRSKGGHLPALASLRKWFQGHLKLPPKRIGVAKSPAGQSCSIYGFRI